MTLRTFTPFLAVLFVACSKERISAPPAATEAANPQISTTGTPAPGWITPASWQRTAAGGAVHLRFQQAIADPGDGALLAFAEGFGPFAGKPVSLPFLFYTDASAAPVRFNLTRSGGSVSVEVVVPEGAEVAAGNILSNARFRFVRISAPQLNEFSLSSEEARSLSWAALQQRLQLL